MAGKSVIIMYDMYCKAVEEPGVDQGFIDTGNVQA